MGDPKEQLRQALARAAQLGDVYADSDMLAQWLWENYVFPSRNMLTEITVRTRKPDKWRFVDTGTQQVWRWDQERDGGTFVLVDPEGLALMAGPEFRESLEQLARGEVVAEQEGED